MFVLRRSQGEKIEIEQCALIRVGKIENDLVRLDVTAPFSRLFRAEQNGPLPQERTVIVSLLGIRQPAGKPQRMASVGISVPVGATVRRAELVQQTVPAGKRFPWHRYRVTARFWRSIKEEIQIEIPVNAG